MNCDVILLPEIPISTYNNDYNDNSDNIITYHKKINPYDVDASWIIPSFNNNNNDDSYSNN